ncbi:MAG: phosphatidate cytidylyltransferase [Acidimicrobiia bacterium]|nr:phosphatidate cytidylyltransferase [Acidimicrobiia bacterium]
MTDGRDGEFEVHPGDPWHPGWTDDAAKTAEITPEESAQPPGEAKKRRRFGRKRRERDEAPFVAEEWPDVEEEPDVVVIDDARFRPAEAPVPAAEATPPVVPPASEAPMPAWLSDPPRPEREMPLPVELPSWVGTTSLGAEGVAVEFDEPIEDPTPAEAAVVAPPAAVAPPAVVPTPPPGGDVAADLAAALSALGADDDDDIEVAPVDDAGEADTFDELRRLDVGAADAATTPQVAEDAFEALRRLEAGAPSTGVYGVASKEAFKALQEPDATGEDLADWEAFAGTEAADPGRRRPAAPPPRAESPPVETPAAIADPGHFDDWAASADEPREKKGIWPFRRRRRDDEVVAEEPADWEADGTQVPATWFPEIDEDAVVPPAPALPEEEWPAAAEAVTPSIRPEPEVGRPPVAAQPQVADELQARRQAAMREAEPWEPPAIDTPVVRPVPPPPRSVVPVVSDDDEEADLQAGGPWKLDFDDGTAEPGSDRSEYDPVPPAAVRGDRDEWDERDPDATVELTDPGLRFTEDIYGGSVTIEHRGLAEEIYRLGDEDTEWQAMSAAMPGIETGVVGFEDVADLSTGEEYREAPRSDFGMRVGTGLLLVVFLLGTMFVGGGAMAIFIGAMAMLGIWEFYGTLRRLEFRPLGVIGYLGGLGVLAAGWFHGPIAVPIAVVAMVVLAFFVYAFSPMREDALANGGLTVLGAAWVAGTVAFAFPILRQAEFRVLVMAVVAATVAMDVGAYSFGRTWGKRALAPVVSPNKSVEGLVGGILLAMGAAVAFGYLAEPFEISSGIALGVVVSVMAPLGDLAESMVKRSLGVKDMGTILPGHGGVLDRIDGFLFVLPAAWVLYQVTGFLG